MRTLRKIRQKMKYSIFDKSVEVYEYDDNGDKIIDYIKKDGTIVYRTTGSVEDIYKTPVDFVASISSTLNAMHAREYSVDQSSVYSEICVPKGYVPLKFGSKIWRKNEITWKDEDAGIPDQESSDYTVVGVLTEYLNFDWYLLQRNN